MRQMAWGLPFPFPTNGKVPDDAPSEPPGSHRQKYVVTAVTVDHTEQGRGQTRAETVYKVSLRPAGNNLPIYAHYVAQPAGAAAPYQVGGIVELDPRLVEEDR